MLGLPSGRCIEARPRTTIAGIADLRRWQTISGGWVIERAAAGGSGFLRQHSERIGLLYYRGWARPPKGAQAAASGHRGQTLPLYPAPSIVVAPSRGLRRRRAGSDVIIADQVIAGLLQIGLAFIGAAGS